MGISRATWEQMVTEARTWKETEGTARAITHVLYEFRMGFTDKNAEIDFVIALERAINGPRPFPTFIPPIASRRQDPGPATREPIRPVMLPQPDRIRASSAWKELQQQILEQPSGLNPGTRPYKGKKVSRVENDPEPSNAVRLIKKRPAPSGEPSWPGKDRGVQISQLAALAKKINERRA
jgi:hypothetical protein